MASVIPTVINFCRFRVTRLNADGTVAAGPKNSYVTAKVQSLAYTPNVQAGTQQTLEGGCNCVEAAFRGPDILLNFSLVLTKLPLQPELEEMMTGGALVLDAASTPAPIGVSWPHPISCGSDPPLVAVEGWTNNWVKSGQALTPYRFTHWVWPAVTWQWGAATLGGSFATPVLNGITRDNPAWVALPGGNGPYADLPAHSVGIDSGGGYVFADTQPAVTDAYATASST